jgi:hypothetical protein
MRPERPRIGRYEVLGELGKGGMGVVLRARAPDGVEVAIKVLKKLDPRRVDRFDRERRLLARFTLADGFVPLVDAGTCADGPYLVMPFVPGGTLRRRLARGALGIEESLSIARALAEALTRAHALGIVHRDVKPENVIFDAAGRPLLADLGLAKHFDRELAGAEATVSLTAAGAVYGTAGYMPPEQMLDTKSVGPAADVFAFGAVLYECLAGKPVCEGDNFVEIFASASERAFAPLRATRPEVPAWLEDVVERSLRRSPSERFADGAALRKALEGPPPVHTLLWRRKKRAILAGGFAIAFAAIAIPWLRASSLAAREERTARALERVERDARSVASVFSEVDAEFAAIRAEIPESGVPALDLAWAAFDARRGAAASSLARANLLVHGADATSVAARRLVADALWRLDRREQAERQLAELARVQDPVLADWICLRRATDGRAEPVARARDRALGGNDTDSHLLVAELAEAAGDGALEARSLERVLGARPDDARALVLHALLRRSGKSIEALRAMDDPDLRAELETAQRIGSPEIAASPRAAFARALDELAERRFAVALPDLDAALDGGLDAVDLHVYRGWFRDDRAARSRARTNTLQAGRARELRPSALDEALAASCVTLETEHRLAAFFRDAAPAVRPALEAAVMASARGAPFESVRALFDTAVQVSPQDVAARRERARFLMSRGRCLLAAEELDRLRETKSARLACLEADVQFRRGRYEDSYDAAGRAMALDPHGPDGLVAALRRACIDQKFSAASQCAEALAGELGRLDARVLCLRLRREFTLDELEDLLALDGRLDGMALTTYIGSRFKQDYEGARSVRSQHAVQDAYADAIMFLFREAPTPDNFILAEHVTAEADKGQLLAAARDVDPGSPFYEEALGYQAIDLRNPAKQSEILARGPDLEATGKAFLAEARAHFRAARAIDPRWWMRDPVPVAEMTASLPIADSYKSLLKDFDHGIQTLRDEFKRTR